MLSATSLKNRIFKSGGKNVFSAVLINDTDGRTNIGCRLTSQTLKKTLIRAFLDSNCNLTIASAPYLFRKRKREISRVWCKKESVSTSTPNGGSCFLGHSFKKWIKQLAHAEYGKRSTGLALASDVVFFQPEGTLADDSSFDRIAGFLSLPILAIINGKKVICINGTVPKYTGINHDVVKFLFENCFASSARDRLTSDYYGCDFSPDAALGYKTNCSSGDERKKLLITTGARNTAEEDLFIIDHAIKYAEKSGLIPLVLTKASRRFESRKESIQSMGGEFLKAQSLEDAEMKLKDCALHIGGRYHMAIFSLKFGTPSLLYDIRTHKNIWLSQEFEEISLFDKSSDCFTLADTLLNKGRVDQWKVSERLSELNEQYHSGVNDLAHRIVSSSHLYASELFS